MKRWPLCFALTLALGACKKEAPAEEPKKEAVKAEAAPTQPPADPKAEAPKAEAPKAEAPKAEEKPAEVTLPEVPASAGVKDPAFEDAVKAVVANCTIHKDYGSADSCKGGEKDAFEALVREKGPAKGLETMSVLLGSEDENTRKFVAGALYGSFSSHIGTPYIYRELKENPALLTKDVALRLAQGLTRVEGQLRFYALPTAVHAAVLAGTEATLFHYLEQFKEESLNETAHANLMVFGRMKHFPKLEARAKSEDPKVAAAAINGVRGLPEPTPEELEVLCPWAKGFLGHKDLQVVTAAAYQLLLCGGVYVDALQDQADERVKAGQFEQPFAMVMREICFAPMRGAKVAGTEAQCARNFSFLQAVADNKTVDWEVRGQALWNIYYQRRDQASLDLMRQYEKHPVPTIAWDAKDAIRSLVESYKLTDGKPVDTAEKPRTLGWHVTAYGLEGQKAKSFTFYCPPKRELAPVFGTDTYTQNSSICSAAVHSGKYTTEGGAAVEIVMKPGAEKYVGSEKNGVTSRDYGQYDASFTVKSVKPIDG